MQNHKLYSITFNASTMNYDGLFYVDSSDDTITNLKFNIRDIDELLLNPQHEYMFTDYTMFTKLKNESTWDRLNMEFFSITQIRNDEYLICDDTDPITIRSYITVNKKSRMVTRFIVCYTNVDCLALPHNSNKIYKFINNKAYFTPFLFENAHSGAFSSAKSNGSMRIENAQRCITEKSWEEVFNIQVKIEALNITSPEPIVNPEPINRNTVSGPPVILNNRNTVNPKTINNIRQMNKPPTQNQPQTIINDGQMNHRNMGAPKPHNLRGLYTHIKTSVL